MHRRHSQAYTICRPGIIGDTPGKWDPQDLAEYLHWNGGSGAPPTGFEPEARERGAA